MIQIAVLGYGTVGSGVVEVINRNQESINKKAGEEINIKYVLDLRDFPGDPVQEKIVHDYEVIANDPEIKIVVEVMAEPIRRIHSLRERWRAANPYVLPIKNWLRNTVWN